MASSSRDTLDENIFQKKPDFNLLHALRTSSSGLSPILIINLNQYYFFIIIKLKLLINLLLFKFQYFLI